MWRFLLCYLILICSANTGVIAAGVVIGVVVVSCLIVILIVVLVVVIVKKRSCKSYFYVDL